MEIRFPREFNLADYCLFDRITEGLGNKDAILFGKRAYSYTHIADRSRGFARWLRASGIGNEQRVYIVGYDTPAFVWAFFGTVANGSVVAMGNPEAPAADLAFVLDYIRASALVTTPRVAQALRDAITDSQSLRALLLVPETTTGEDVEGDVHRLDFDVRRLAIRPLARAIQQGMAESFELPKTRRDDMAIWLFTSGSTGRPKAAMHSHGDFAFSTEAYAKRTIGYRRDDVTVSIPRLFFGYATGTNLIFPFAAGATVGLFPERPTIESLSQAITTFRPTIVTNVPTMMRKLLDHDDELIQRAAPRLDLSSVRIHLSAGEALCPTLHARFSERFGADIYDGIGSAEMFHIYASNRPGDIKPGSVGKVVEGYSIKILPPDAEGPGAPEVPRGETGIMWVRGPSVGLGYYEDRANSWETFFGPWCKTGDLFRMDEEGYLWFAGRADDLLKVGGQWLAPLEVEQCLMSHPDVSLAAVIGIEELGLVKPRAFVVVKEGSKSRIAAEPMRTRFRLELQAHIRERLSKYKYPRSIIFIDDLPKNDRGKIDRKALRSTNVEEEKPS